MFVSNVTVSTVTAPLPPPSFLARGPSGADSVAADRQRGPASAESTDTDKAPEAAARGKVAEGDGARPAGSETLTQEQLRQVEQLKTIDREVRQHEMAHQIAGGPYTGHARYSYQMGPDGQRYAVAGEVPIDYGPVAGDPRATIDKMQQVIAAALAPADPSPTDHQVAAQARQTLLTAQLELARQQADMNTARQGAGPPPQASEMDRVA